MPIRIALIGYGKIAADQHLPAIRANPAFRLVAAVGPRLKQGPLLPEGPVPVFPDLAALLAGCQVDAVAICTPPGPRYAIAAQALDRGLAVLAEKPPTATLGEAEDLQARATAGGATLFTAWHAQHNRAVEVARALLAGATVTRLRIDWLEDVRKWHPGQQWIWAPGGFGVFDPGINALSIATRICPMPLLLRHARLAFPANRQAPIAAELAFHGGDFTAAMDWNHSGSERWTIAVDTAGGERLELLHGGARLKLHGVEQTCPGPGEYPALYARFAELVAARRSEVDNAPLRIVADAFLLAERAQVEPFD